MDSFAINGRIFEYPLTGVGRFCYEVILELDKLVENGKVVLIISGKAQNVPDLKNIVIKKIGKRSGIFWEQIELPIYLKKRKLKCLSMSSSVPLLKADYVLIHDISLKVNKNSNSSIKDKFKIWWPLLQYRCAMDKANVLFTDSEFQKREIQREYKRIKSPITVVYAGWQHMLKIKEDEECIKYYGLKKKTYAFAVSTRAKNKNFIWIYNVAKKNPNMKFVVAGKLDSKFFTDSIDFNGVENIISTGYICDEKMKALMKNAKVFIYPSFYEGFGLPPLEALSVDTKVIVANSSCLPEIYGEYVYYIDPKDSNVDIDSLIKDELKDKEELLKKYSWKITAKIIYSTIKNMRK